jgi:hypothetical protein
MSMHAKQFMINCLHRHFAVGAYDADSDPARRRRQAATRFVCDSPARLVSGDRSISIEGAILKFSDDGAKVEAAYPHNGPSIVFLHDLADNELYECEISWNSGRHVGLQILDVVGPARRRKFFAGQKVPAPAAPLFVGAGEKRARESQRPSRLS